MGTLKAIVDKLTSQAALIAFGLVVVGAYLLRVNASASSVPGFLGAGLIVMGAAFLVVSFVLSLLYEDREQTSKLYRPIVDLWKGSARDLQTKLKEVTVGQPKDKIGGSKRSYKPVDVGNETEAE